MGHTPRQPTGRDWLCVGPLQPHSSGLASFLSEVKKEET